MQAKKTLILGFGENLAALMKERSITQGDLAKVLRVSQGTISKYQSGRIPKARALQKLAAFFGTTIEMLINREPSGANAGTSAGSWKAPTMQEFEARALRTLPERIRWLREKLGLSISEFARSCGFSPGYLSRLEAGKRTKPSAEFQDALLVRFNVDRFWLLTGSGMPFGPGKDSVAQANVAKTVDELLTGEKPASGAVLETERGNLRIPWRAEIEQEIELTKVLGSICELMSPEQLLLVIKCVNDDARLSASAKAFWKAIFGEWAAVKLESELFEKLTPDEKLAYRKKLNQTKKQDRLAAAGPHGSPKPGDLDFVWSERYEAERAQPTELEWQHLLGRPNYMSVSMTRGAGKEVLDLWAAVVKSDEAQKRRDGGDQRPGDSDLMRAGELAKIRLEQIAVRELKLKVERALSDFRERCQPPPKPLSDHYEILVDLERDNARLLAKQTGPPEGKAVAHKEEHGKEEHGKVLKH